MFDHVGIAVSDLVASERFYRSVLGEPSYADAGLVEWDDWAIGPSDGEHPVARGLQVDFRVPDRPVVERHDDDAGFRVDPDGNRVEVTGHHEGPLPDGRIDHVWFRVRDPLASRRFYTTIAPHAGLALVHDAPDCVRLTGADFSLSLVRDERPLTAHVHLAFPAEADAVVRAFHAAALAAGYEDNGGPGERAVYHPGYYGAFVLDPDGHNIEVVNHNL